ncbi:MAG TPA: DNA polymerase Y family protein [Bryobacteraceae bacterium]|nr:DNA polymerase Y family protein [Bryobacteraceae bacterium]
MARCFLSLYCPDITCDRLTQLVEWCDRYSPLASQDGRDGIILDITGCTHLFGGEGPLLLDLSRRLHRMGIEAHAAIADSWGIGWALARYGKRFIVHGDAAIAALDPLPVEALRLPVEIVLELRRLGLSTIAAVRKIPRHSLAARFGSTLLWRLDQAFHQAEEPLTPWRPPAPYRASRILGEPISTVPAVEYVLRDLLEKICTKLEKNRLGLRHMDLACYRVDGTMDRCEVRTSKPTRSLPHLMRLFHDRLDTLRSGFGFEAFILSVLDTEAVHPTQFSLLQVNPVENEASFDALVDRLGMKLGFHEVNRIQVCESYLPEHAVEFRPATISAVASAEWPDYRVRPIRMIDPPMSIHVSILIPGGSPVQLLIGRQKHRIIRSEGPERLHAEWWRDHNSRWDTRDYYRIEDDKGFRFWIFRDRSEHWFLHGHFA